MFTANDFTIMIEEADYIFDNLPFESRFSFKWKKANVKPTSVTYTTIWENIPGILIPPSAQSSADTHIGEIIKEDHLELAIPKKFGETLAIDGLTYSGGVQIHDVIETQYGDKYHVKSKGRRGFGAYYVLTLIPYKGRNDDWLEGQYDRS